MLWVWQKPSNDFQNRIQFGIQSSPCLLATSPPASLPLGSSAHATWLYFWPLKTLRSFPSWYYLHVPVSEKLFSHIFTWWHAGHSDFSWLWPLQDTFPDHSLRTPPLPAPSLFTPLCFSIITHVYTWCLGIDLFVWNPCCTKAPQQ